MRLFCIFIWCCLNLCVYAGEHLNEPAGFNKLSKDLVTHIESFLSLEDLVPITNVSSEFGESIIPMCTEMYAQCVVDDRFVPGAVKAILADVTATTKQEEITNIIVKKILTKSTGVFHRTWPIPPFLVPYFREVSTTEMMTSLESMVNPSICSAVVQHLNACWVGVEMDTNSLMKAHAHIPFSYVSLVDALAKPFGLSAKYIIATAAEIENRGQQMEALFKNYPECELIVDFGAAVNNIDFLPLPGSLRHLSIVGASVTTIGNDFLDGCTGLTSVKLPPGVTTIGDGFLYGCKGLTSVKLPPGVTTIGNDFLDGCKGLTSFILPPGVTTIGNDFLFGCKGLTSVSLPPGVTMIGNRFLVGCAGLTSVSLPPGVTMIGNYFLVGCRGLTSVSLPTSVTTIGDRFLYGCTGLTSVRLPPGVITIGDYFLDGCAGLTSVRLPPGVTTIGNGFLVGCTDLTSVRLPSGVTTIGDKFLDGCTSLTSIMVEEGSAAERIIQTKNPQLKRLLIHTS